MKLNMSCSLFLTSLITSALLATSSATSLRTERQLPERYSKAKGGGAGSASKRKKSSSPDIIVDSIPETLVSGENDEKFLGFSVSSAGDVNGDGIDDVIIGVPRKNSGNTNNEVGAAFVIFGKDGELPDLENLDAVDGTNGFAIYGKVLLDHVGFVVSDAGDINGDGFADVIVGAPRVDGSLVEDSGQAFVIFGSDKAFDAVVDVETLNGSNGFVIQGNGVQDYLGSSVSFAGDVNGDGIDDVIIGAPGADSFGVTFHNAGGEAYVIYGSTDEFPAVFFITDLDGINGFVLEAEGEFDNFGRSVSYAGDVNNDGYGDILVGATTAMNPEWAMSGATYVIYGSADVAASVEVSSLDGTNGYKMYGNSDYEEFGHALAPVGDVNGDNIDDFVVGCPLCRPDRGNYGSGMAFIFYGTASAKQVIVEADTLVFGEESFDSLGQDVSSAGDVNGDGVADILILSGRSVGGGKNAELHIIYGSSNDLPETILAQDFVDNSNIGAEIQVFPLDFLGKNDRIVSASFAGDINNDGKSDIIIGLPNVEVGNAPGKGIVKVLLGKHD